MADSSQVCPLGLVAEQRASSGSSAVSRSHSGISMPRADSGVRSAAGRSNSRSRAACTSVPRAVAVVGGSGSRSITRNRYSSGQVMKSAARDGDSAGPPGRSASSAGVSSPGVSARAGSPPACQPSLQIPPPLFGLSLFDPQRHRRATHRHSGSAHAVPRPIARRFRDHGYKRPDMAETGHDHEWLLLRRPGPWTPGGAAARPHGRSQPPRAPSGFGPNERGARSIGNVSSTTPDKPPEGETSAAKPVTGSSSRARSASRCTSRPTGS